MSLLLTANIFEDSVALISSDIFPILGKIAPFVICIYIMLFNFRFIRSTLMCADARSSLVVLFPTIHKESVSNAVPDGGNVEICEEETKEWSVEDTYEKCNDSVEDFPKMVYSLNCPNCGAPIKENSRKCAWCDSELMFARSRFGG